MPSPLKLVAHIWDDGVWYLASMLERVRPGRTHAGQYVVEYRESRTRARHELPAESYGPRKTWVIITKPR